MNGQEFEKVFFEMINVVDVDDTAVQQFKCEVGAVSGRRHETGDFFLSRRGNLIQQLPRIIQHGLAGVLISDEQNRQASQAD